MDFITPCPVCRNGFVAYSDLLNDKSCDNPRCSLHQPAFLDKLDEAFEKAVASGKLIPGEVWVDDDGNELQSWIVNE